MQKELLSNLPILLTIALPVGLYLGGLVQLWRHSGIGHGIALWRAAVFMSGMSFLLISLASPLDELADQAFSMHMLQHTILILIVAPLLVLGNFPVAFLWVLPRNLSQQVGRWWRHSQVLRPAWALLSQPLVAWSSFGISIWVWHAPVFYQAALDNPAIHVLEHATFLATAIVFWWFLLQPARRKITRYGTAVLYLFTTLLHVSVLGGLLTFSAQTWIPAYTASAGIGGLSPLQDQQLAGLIMWLPGGVLFTILTVLTFGAWLQVVEQRMQEKERSQQGYSRMRRQGQAPALKRRVQIEKLGTGERNEQKIG